MADSSILLDFLPHPDFADAVQATGVTPGGRPFTVVWGRPKPTDYEVVVTDDNGDMLGPIHCLSELEVRAILKEL